MSKKWAFLLCAVLFAAGCGGGGSSGVTPPINTTASTTLSLPSTKATITFNFLSGQGRVNDWDQWAQLGSILMVDGYGPVDTTVNAPINILLNGYTANQYSVQCTMPTDVNGVPLDSRVFSVFPLTFTAYLQTPIDFNSTNPTFDVNENEDAQIRAFPGRTVGVNVRLNDGDTIITYNYKNGFPDSVATYSWNHDQFITDNIGSGGKFTATFADFLEFDLTGVAGKPKFSSDSSTATKLFLSGDGTALGTTGATGAFELHNGSQVATGTFTEPVDYLPGKSLGAYQLIEYDPRDLTGVAQIGAAVGSYRKIADVFQHLTTSLVVTFPSASDDNTQQIVLVALASNAPTNVYVGTADLTAKTFTAYPVAQVLDSSHTGVVSGTLSSLKDVNAAATTSVTEVRTGTYTITSGTVTGVPSTGSFLVYRE